MSSKVYLHLHVCTQFLCLSNIHNKKVLICTLSCNWLPVVKWFTYPVCFGWLPVCCLSYTACRGWWCKSEWSIFPQADAGTSYRMSLPRTLSWEGSRAPQRPKWKGLVKMNELLYDKTRPACRFFSRVKCGYKTERMACLVHGGEREPSVLPLGYVQHRDCCCLLVSNRVHRNDRLDPLRGNHRQFSINVTATAFRPHFALPEMCT